MILDDDSSVVIARSKVAKELDEAVVDAIMDAKVEIREDTAEVAMIKATQTTGGRD